MTGGRRQVMFHPVLFSPGALCLPWHGVQNPVVVILLAKATEAIFSGQQGNYLFKASSEELEGPICFKSPVLVYQQVRVLYSEEQGRGAQRAGTDLYSCFTTSSQLWFILLSLGRSLGSCFLEHLHILSLLLSRGNPMCSPGETGRNYLA